MEEYGVLLKQKIVVAGNERNLSSLQPSSNDLPIHWSTVQLGDVGELKDGNWILREDYSDQGVRLLQVGDIGLGEFIGKSRRYISMDRAIELKCTFLSPGDILISRMAEPVGRACLLPELPYPSITAVDVSIFRVNTNILNKFYAVFALNYAGTINQAEALAYGVTRKRITRMNLAKVKIPLPPPSEQQAIAKILRTTKTAIQVRRDELKLERERKAAFMEYLFTHGTRGEPRKQTELGEIPESWQVVELGDIITLHRGYDLPTRDRKPGLVPIISSSGISGTHSDAKVKAPGVVTGRYGTIGEVFYVEQDFWPLNTTLFVCEFRRVTPHFVAYLLRTLNFNIFNDKSTVPGVNRNDLHRIKTVLPPPSEQQDFVDVLSAHDNKLSALEQETLQLEELFNALLDELMTGRQSTLPLNEEEGNS